MSSCVRLVRNQLYQTTNENENDMTEREFTLPVVDGTQMAHTIEDWLARSVSAAECLTILSDMADELENLLSGTGTATVPVHTCT